MFNTLSCVNVMQCNGGEVHCHVLHSEGFLASLTKTLQKHVPVGATSRDAQDNLEYSMKRVSVKWIGFVAVFAGIPHLIRILCVICVVNSGYG